MIKNIFPFLFLLLPLSYVHAASTFTVEVRGTGAPMILIPGLSCSGEVWKNTVIHFQDRYQCHVVTLAGFAGNPPLDEPGFLEHVKDDLITYIKANHLNHPIVIGHSLGGFLALWMASSEPDLMGKVVVVDALPFLPAAFYPTLTAQKAQPFAQGMKKQMLAQSDSAFRASQKANFRMLITDTAIADAASMWGVHSDKATVAECIYEMQTTDLRPELAKITVPTLVFATWIAYAPQQTHDGIAEVFKAQYATLPGYELIVEDHARHFVMLDDPTGFFNAVMSFLAKK